MDLEHSSAFHLRSEVAFTKGQRATLHALYQSLTYGGWLEGMPWREWNDKIIAGTLSSAEKHCASGGRPFLLPPERRADLRDPAQIAKIRELLGQEPGFLRHEPEWLPAVTCVGVFYGPIARDQTKHLGVLTVVWFQREYAPPIAEPYATQLINLDWCSLATDVEL